MIFEVTIKNPGLNARKGNVIDNGEIFIAFIYNMSAVVSNGTRKMRIRKKMWSSVGISMKGRKHSKNGEANPMRTHKTIYSFFSFRTFLLSASAVATQNAQKREMKSQFKGAYILFYAIVVFCP